MAEILFKDRYLILPELADYDSLDEVLNPYLGITARGSHQSKVVTTDSLGFRPSKYTGGWLDSSNWPQGKEPGIVIGSSSVFGVGASNDGGTLVSQLNVKQGGTFLNLGIRGANSTQELISSIPFLERASNIIVCSGINDLLLSIIGLHKHDLFGSMYGDRFFNNLTAWEISDISKLAQKPFSLNGFRTALRAPESRNLLPPREEITETSLQAALKRAVTWHRRDLRFLTQSRAQGARIVFALQPFALIGSKVLTDEEVKLFAILDELQGVQWQVLKSSFHDLWGLYTEKIRKMCAELNVSFIDLNNIELSGWCYVDRAHMTDYGYSLVSDALASYLND